MAPVPAHHQSGRSARSVLLFCNGEPPGRALARSLVSTADLVVAADGGANTARRHGVRPHVIIGDLDSIRPATRKAFASSMTIHVRRQDNTDLEKALDYLKGRGVAEVFILGATGRRVDFTLANLSVMWKYTPPMNLTIIGDEWYAMAVQGRRSIPARPGTTVSLIPFGMCRGITLKGLQYPLTESSMRVGEIGVSNVVTRSPFTVIVRSGKMLVFVMAPYDHSVVR